jgi:hypothetical protein
MRRSFRVIDDFYPKPDAIRQRAIGLDYSEPETLVGWRTHAYHPRGISNLIEKKFKIKIAYWESDLEATEVCNGVFFSAFSRGSRSERVGIHFDEPCSWLMLLVYLTPNAPCDAGTSFWQHQKTGLLSAPTRRDAERLRTTVKGLTGRLLRDSQSRDRWIEVDRVGNVYNRALIFPSGLLHSASRHFGSTLSNGRVYQTFHFPIKRGSW